MAITREEVLHVARLARLELSEDEVTRFQEQLSAILEAVSKVSELDLSDVPPTSHPLEIANAWAGRRAAPLPDPRRGRSRTHPTETTTSSGPRRRDRHTAAHRRTGEGLLDRGEVSAASCRPPTVKRSTSATSELNAYLTLARGAGRRRHPDRAQGRDLDEGRSHDRRLEDPRELRPRVRLDRRGALQGARDAPARQDEHRRVRDGLVERELRLRPVAQPVGSHARARRLRRRLGAAVSGGLAPWALGSDTGGSVKLPSAFCGNVGLRPTYGTVSRFGIVAFASSLDQVGPVAKNVRDSAFLYRSSADATRTTRPPSTCRRSSSRGATTCGGCASACPGS